MSAPTAAQSRTDTQLKPAPMEMLVDLARSEKEYFDRKLDLEDALGQS